MPFLKSRSHFFFFGCQGHPGRARGTQGKAKRLKKNKSLAFEEMKVSIALGPTKLAFFFLRGASFRPGWNRGPDGELSSSDRSFEQARRSQEEPGGARFLIQEEPGTGPSIWRDPCFMVLSLWGLFCVV